MRFKSARTDEFRVGDKVLTFNGFEGSVAYIQGRYVVISIPGMNDMVTIPSHGEILNKNLIDREWE